jgi:hypothetical protein
VNGAFSDRDGEIPDNGFRTGIQFEAWGKAGAFFKMTANVQGLAFGESLAKSRFAASYYFPVPKNSFIRISRIHFNLDGNSLLQTEPGSAAQSGFGLYVGPVLTSSEISIHGNDERNENALPRIDDFKALKMLSFSEELQYRMTIWTFRTKFTYTREEKNDNKIDVYGLQFYTAANWKWGRVSGTFRFDNFPNDWTFTIRCQLRNRFLFGKEKPSLHP